MHRTICISALLLLAGFPCLAADVHLGPEVALGPALNAGSPQGQVRLAQASAHRLAVWVSDQGLTGALDGLRIDIPLVGVTPTIVGVAGGRTNFLVAYQARMTDFSTPLLAVRVSFDGRVLDAAPIVVLTDTRGVWGGGVAYDGAEFVIATMIKAPGLPSVMHASDIITGRVADDGTVRTGSRLKPTLTSGIPAWPNIGSAGSRVVVGYSVQFFNDSNLGPWGLSDLQLDPQQAADGTVGETVFPDANSPGGLQSSMAVGPDRVTFAWLTTDGMMMSTTINVAQRTSTARRYWCRESSLFPHLFPRSRKMAMLPWPGTAASISWPGSRRVMRPSAGSRDSVFAPTGPRSIRSRSISRLIPWPRISRSSPSRRASPSPTAVLMPRTPECSGPSSVRSTGCRRRRGGTRQAGERA